MDIAPSSSSCINCGNEVNGPYCANCGQRTRVSRMSFKVAWNDFWSRLYGFDGMMPRTLRDLTIRPGLVAKDFIKGVRVKYYGPVGYFFLMVTLLLLLLSSFGLSFGELVEETRKSLPVEDDENFMSEWILEFVSNNAKLVIFLAIPFQGFAARYLYFRKSGHRLIEHMVLPFYMTGHLTWITIVLVLFRVLSGVMIPNYAAIVSFIFYGFGYMTWMTQQSKLKSFVKGMAVFVTGQILFMISIVLVAIIAIIWIALFDPETFELIRPKNN